MKVITDWINSHKGLTVCIALFLLLVQPLLVHLFLKIPAPSPFFVREWNAGDLLTYIAGFEAFLGTVFLGIVAVRQNDKANDISDRLLHVEEKSGLLMRCPNLKIEKPKIQAIDFWEHLNYSYILFCSEETSEEINSKKIKPDKYLLSLLQITNLSSSSVRIKLHKMHLESFFEDSPSKEYEVLPSTFPVKSLDIPSNSTDCVGFIVNPSDFANDNIVFGFIILSVTNSASEEYHYTINFFLGLSPELRLCELRISEISYVLV